MAYEHREALDAADPHNLLFGPDDREEWGPATRSAPTRSGRHGRARQRRRRRRHLVVVIAIAVVLIAGVVGWVFIRPALADHTVADWPGPGTGQVRVRVNPGDGTTAIAQSLTKAGVVRSSQAFTDAARANSDAQNLQPGLYQLKQQMSGAQALALMLDPASRLVVKLTLPEGTAERDVVAKLAAALKVTPAAVQSAAADIGNLGIPAGYTQNGAAPKTAEGFLYPATYEFDPGTSPVDALQQMTAQFISQDRDLNFAGSAKQRQVTPYQALVIASMIEGEAKYDGDRAKVARVIYNRLAAGNALKIDATSRYGAVLQGKDPASTPYAQLNSPYNTYLHTGLPPTPINNPGSAAMTAAVNPAPGNWLFYVNGDAQGHLSFFDNETDFTKAVALCRAKGWGCD